MALFVCHRDLSVCCGRSLPREFKTVSGRPFCKVAMTLGNSGPKLPQLFMLIRKGFRLSYLIQSEE